VIIAIAVERKGFGKKSKRWKLGRTRIQVVSELGCDTIVWSRRGQAGKRRGPQPKA
jgi:hypothetical protein